MSTASFKGGDKLRAHLAKLTAGLKTASSVDVGWNKEATYGPEHGGQYVASVAAMNEWGGAFTVPEHEQTITRQMKDSGEFSKGAKFVKASKGNFQTTHTIPAHTVTVPARPFFRSMIAAKQPEWANGVGNALNVYDFDTEKALSAMGETIRSQLSDSIRDFNSPRNAPSTIARKGFDNPLIDSGHMMNSTNYWVK